MLAGCLDDDSLIDLIDWLMDLFVNYQAEEQTTPV